MSKNEFIDRLAQLLADVSPEERDEALTYYREYIEDAGLENEEAILQELGSPEVGNIRRHQASIGDSKRFGFPLFQTAPCTNCRHPPICKPGSVQSTDSCKRNRFNRYYSCRYTCRCVKSPLVSNYNCGICYFSRHSDRCLVWRHRMCTYRY